ncbi:mediator complex, subunit Med11 [Xylariomycetidae sp. FL2044]|nr:mediator complex, subunit Med11 [Xylariomycetidae sp. FL2044]
METHEGQDTFVPFTKAERIQQLSETDKNIVSLLRSTAQAVESLGKRESTSEDTVMTDSDQAQIFKDSMEDFLQTLRSVNVGMKRQIWGLEEARIVSLAKDKAPNTREEGGEVQGTTTRSLEPDGDGKIGGLDVGWLNSRSNKVGMDMEADLWDQAETLLRETLQSKGQGETTKSS